MPSLLSPFSRSLINCCRYFHSTPSWFVDKQLLSQLRKNTGFTIINCKKALELHENDYEKAEEWIKKEAEKQGWQKATKLGSRVTPQGLVGFCTGKNFGVMAELNCETDFVARNENFQMLMEEVLKSLSDVMPRNTNAILKEEFSKEQLQDLPTPDGKKLGDIIAYAIGKISENIILTRATRIYTPSDLHLYGYAHPSSIDNPKFFGSSAALVIFRNPSDDPYILRALSAHIVGKNPSSIGSLEDVKIQEEPEEDQPTNAAEESEGKEGSEAAEEMSDSEEAEVEEDTRLVHQKLLTNQDYSVGEVLIENNMEIIDFVRYKCGETSNSD